MLYQGQHTIQLNNSNIQILRPQLFVIRPWLPEAAEGSLRAVSHSDAILTGRMHVLSSAVRSVYLYVEFNEIVERVPVKWQVPVKW